MFVRLTHYSNKPGCEGVPGDVVEVDEGLGNQWIASSGAVAMTDYVAETAEDEIDESAELQRKSKSELASFIKANGGKAPSKATHADLMAIAEDIEKRTER